MGSRGGRGSVRLIRGGGTRLRLIRGGGGPRWRLIGGSGGSGWRLIRGCGGGGYGSWGLTGVVVRCTFKCGYGYCLNVLVGCFLLVFLLCVLGFFEGGIF